MSKRAFWKLSDISGVSLQREQHVDKDEYGTSIKWLSEGENRVIEETRVFGNKTLSKWKIEKEIDREREKERKEKKWNSKGVETEVFVGTKKKYQ